MTDTPHTAAGLALRILNAHGWGDYLPLDHDGWLDGESSRDHIRRHLREAEAADSQAVRLPTVEALARALHRIGNEFDDPFTAEHPEVMHTSQAAAILAALKGQP